MTNTADPYIVQIPTSIVNRDGGPSEEFKAWLIYDNRFKHDLWRQNGGGEDLFVTLQDQITSNDTDITALQAADIALDARIDVLEALADLDVVTTAINYTTTGNVVVRATDQLLITLNATPADREYATIYHDGGDNDLVTVTDGTNTDTITKNDTVVTYTYYSDLSKWVP